MTTANVGLTSGMGTRVEAQRRLDNAQKRLDNVNKELAQEVDAYQQTALQWASSIVEIEKLKVISAENRLAAAVANSQQKISKTDHGILLNALAKTILVPVTKSQPATSTVVENANKAKQLAEPYLIKYEELNTPELTHFVEEAKCMKLQSGTVKVIIDLLKAKPINWKRPDLTRFQNQLDPKALETLLLDPQVDEVVLDPRVQGTDAMKKAQEIQAFKKKSLKVFFQTNDGLVEVKPISLAVSTSTASPTPVPNHKKDSPENSPPKVGIVSKPLPAPPSKALPPTPVKRDKQP